MIKFSLVFSKLLKKPQLIRKLNDNIYNEIKYPTNKVMIIDDNLDFNLLNNLLNYYNFTYLTIKINDDKDLNNFIVKNTDKYGYINKDFLFFKVKTKDIKKYGSIINPNYILINETSDIINPLEVKDIFDNATIISLDIHDFKAIKYSINNKSVDYYISNVDYIKEKITINKKYDINIVETSEEYLKEILMFFSFLSTINYNIQSFNEISKKFFSYDNKKIYIDVSETNYNDIIKFIVRYSDYKVIIIGWKNNCEDISWLYNIEFERLINKNIQKIYCIGPNAFDIATRLKYADINEKILVASSNIDVVLKEIKKYNLNLYVLTDEYYQNIIKGDKK